MARVSGKFESKVIISARLRLLFDRMRAQTLFRFALTFGRYGYESYPATAITQSQFGCAIDLERLGVLRSLG